MQRPRRRKPALHWMSVLWCNQCHDMEVPDSWADSIDEAAQIQVDKQIKVAA